MITPTPFIEIILEVTGLRAAMRPEQIESIWERKNGTTMIRLTGNRFEIASQPDYATLLAQWRMLTLEGSTNLNTRHRVPSYLDIAEYEIDGPNQSGHSLPTDGQTGAK